MLHVVVVWPKPGVTFDKVEQRMKESIHSMYRLTPTAWVVCSQHDHVFWSEQLKSFGNVFVSALYQNDGWMPETFWSWLREHSE